MEGDALTFYKDEKSAESRKSESQIPLSEYLWVPKNIEKPTN